MDIGSVGIGHFICGCHSKNGPRSPSLRRITVASVKAKRGWAHRGNDRTCNKQLQAHKGAHLVIDMGHKPVERVCANLDIARGQRITDEEKELVFSGDWQDPEVDVGKRADDSRIIICLSPKKNQNCAPDPGAIHKPD